MRPILHLAALASELGPELTRRIDPLLTGVGPVEAAVAVAAALAEARAAGALPRLAVCLGSAGSRRLPRGGVFQATALSWRDMDATALGFAPGETPLSGLPPVVALPHRVPGVPGATLSTGADVVSGAGYDAIGADMVDMESYAAWRACHRFGVPFACLRGISDGAEPLTGLHDWADHLAPLDAPLAAALDRLHDAFDAGLFG